jgi:Putative restriction endonuclease
VIWDEQVPPVVVVEFLSPGTEADDLGPFAPKTVTRAAGRPPGKFTLYEQILRVPNYILFDEETGQIRYFRLVNGQYQEQPVATQNPRLWIPEVKLGLGRWNGPFRALMQDWLRWCDAQGNWLPTEAEELRQERDVERQAQAIERQAKEKLEQYLRSIGIDPNNLPPG